MPMMTRSQWKTYCADERYNTRHKRTNALMYEALAHGKMLLETDRAKYYAIEKPLWRNQWILEHDKFNIRGAIGF
jgi:hypothetical protein